MKDVGLRIRIQRRLREEFLKVCQAQDKSAAQVLREFMRNYVADYNPETSQNQQQSETGLSPVNAPGNRAKWGRDGG